MSAADGRYLGHALWLDRPGARLLPGPLELPAPGPDEVLLRVSACGVCRTDLHVADGELPDPRLPLVLGHEVVGRVLATGAGVSGLSPGQRVGVPWLGATCGRCAYCASGRENLCDAPEFNGYTRLGGYADLLLARAHFTLPLPEGLDDLRAAPLLCAGLIGWRALRMAGDARVLGIFGFGAAAHLIAQVAVWQGREVHAYTRAGDTAAQALALDLGCASATDSEAASPASLDAALIFAPVGALVPRALHAVRKGGTVVCAGIHMSEIPAFAYALLWGERTVRSVANLTRADGIEFLDLAARVPLRIEVQAYPLARANDALDDLRAGRVRGAAVLDCRTP
jgi:alcohol dehydrogenase, propanol-preferring